MIDKEQGERKMGLFDKLKEPIFLKETSSAKKQLEALQALLDKVEEKDKEQIKRQIKLIEYGIKGEEQIAFELRNSHMPMYILHDLFFEQDGLSAQIDYLVVTKNCTYILECKNLYGDITINKDGDFIRTMTLGGKTIKEGIYSPITQNTRHMEMIKALRISEKNNFLTKALFNKYFDELYQSVVVLANPKTILKDSYAPKAIKNQVIRADQLIAYIKKVNSTGSKAVTSDQDMERIANFFLSKHIEKPIDYASCYQLKDEVATQKIEENHEVVTAKQMESEALAINEEALIKALKAFRLEQSRKEQVKPYFIFNDKQMMALIEAAPRSLDELIKVSGFGQVKCEKYGNTILDIFKENT